MECKICKSKKNTIIHKGTRDIRDIDVLKCEGCGVTFLSDFSHIVEGFYEESGMHQDGKEYTFDQWRADTKEDDTRRANDLGSYFEGKEVLDFGCGNGGFLHNIKKNAKNVYGVELENIAREMLAEEGIDTRADIREFGGQKFDVITMFHVVEHLTEPKEYLEKMKEYLADSGKLIIETPNANDALLSQYESEAFADFTYWGCHPILYTSNTLEKLLVEAGYRVVWNKQIQRYPLANHLHWLSKGAPGGHKKWSHLSSEVLNAEYKRILEEQQMCDTLLICVEKI